MKKTSTVKIFKILTLYLFICKNVNIRKNLTNIYKERNSFKRFPNFLHFKCALYFSHMSKKNSFNKLPSTPTIDVVYRNEYVDSNVA